MLKRYLTPLSPGATVVHLRNFSGSEGAVPDGAALHEKALRRCTKPGQIVLDCFAGSGSLMVACDQLKRTAYMIERESVFVDLIVRRYEKLTGYKAVKV